MERWRLQQTLRPNAGESALPRLEKRIGISRNCVTRHNNSALVAQYFRNRLDLLFSDC